VPLLLAFISLPLIFVLSVICANSMALTSWTPTGRLSKITQFSMGAIDRTNPASNLIPAGMTAEIAGQRLEPALRHQAGLHAGRKAAPAGLGARDRDLLGRAVLRAALLPALPAARRERRALDRDHHLGAFAMPAAIQWKGVAELIMKGLSALPYSAIVSMIVAAVAAASIEIARIATKGRFPLSAVSIGLGTVLPPESTLGMWVGAMIFWIMGRRHKVEGTRGHAFWVEGDGADLRGAHLGRGAGGDRQCDRQRADVGVSMKRLVSFGLALALCAAGGSAMAQPLPRQPDAAFLGVIVEDVRAQYRAGDDARNRRECEGFKGTARGSRAAHADGHAQGVHRARETLIAHVLRSDVTFSRVACILTHASCIPARSCTPLSSLAKRTSWNVVSAAARLACRSFTPSR
jgi:hypothetical protein